MQTNHTTRIKVVTTTKVVTIRDRKREATTTSLRMSHTTRTHSTERIMINRARRLSTGMTKKAPNPITISKIIRKVVSQRSCLRNSRTM
jgi:hypothetical protein